MKSTLIDIFPNRHCVESLTLINLEQKSAENLNYNYMPKEDPIPPQWKSRNGLNTNGMTTEISKFPANVEEGGCAKCGTGMKVPLPLERMKTPAESYRKTSIKEGKAEIFVKPRKSKFTFRRFAKCLFLTVCCGCLWTKRKKSITAQVKVSNDIERMTPRISHLHSDVAKEEVRHKNDRSVELDEDIDIDVSKGVKHDPTKETIIHYDTLIQDPSQVRKHSSEHRKDYSKKFTFNNQNISCANSLDSEDSRSENDSKSDKMNVNGEVSWEDDEIEKFTHPKGRWHRDLNRVLPSGIEHDEDVTQFFQDELVYVKNITKISTHINKWGNKEAHWSTHMDNLLLKAAKKFPGNWMKISQQLNKSKLTPKQCRQRYEMLTLGKKEGKFSKQEDLQLERGYKQYGNAFAVIAKKFFKNRTAKQLRDRYLKTIGKKKLINHVKDVQRQKEMKKEKAAFLTITEEGELILLARPDN